MRFSLIFALLFTLNIFPIKCQDTAISSTSAGDLFLSLRSMNFVKNNEYSNPVVEGYTLLGFFLHPELVFNPDEKLTLKLGTHLLSYSGTNRFSLIKPLFSATWRFSQNAFFTIGSLSGSDKHRMLDPHFNRENLYTAYSEDGLELTFSDEHIFSNTWLSWENFIFRGDNEREIFTAGESFVYLSPLIADLFRVEIPVQLQFKHYGGQISNYPEHVQTFLNAAAGAKFSLHFGKTVYSSAGMESFLFLGNCLTNNATSGIRNGYAGWYKLFLAGKNAALEAGYWHSDNFYAPNGNFIFSSVSDHIYRLVVPERKLITCSASLKLPYKDFLEFYIAFDGYYDTDLRRFDNAVTLHLRFDKLIRIASIKQHRIQAL